MGLSFSNISTDYCASRLCIVGRHDGDNVIAKEVFRVIQRHGSARYPALATEMGFNNNKITTTTAHCITPEDKLQAIFNVEASAVGSFATTKSMLRACSRIVHPIFGIVAEELRRGKHKESRRHRYSCSIQMFLFCCRC